MACFLIRKFLYPKKRNWVLLNHDFATDWVLFLDADEFVNDAFCDVVAKAVASDEHAGYWLNYTNYFLGRELKHGVPQRKLAMFKIGSGLYERIDETAWSKLDMEIHEHPIIEGTIGVIAERINHRDFCGLERFLDRHGDYAAWEANRVLHLETEPEKKAQLTGRQRFKYRNVERWWYPWFYFFYTYIVKLGVLDGAAGFHYAFYKAWYFLTIKLMIKGLRHSQQSTRNSVTSVPRHYHQDRLS